ncbi:MAG: beta-propeller fold lactonase family protein [Acidobacteriota bacterium]
MGRPNPRSVGARSKLTLLAACVLLLGASSATLGQSPHPDRVTIFESGQVRPLALSPNGQHLYAVNTPDNRLEVFKVRNGSGGAGPLKHIASVQVGLEPVAVAAYSDLEVWVVNHLSDSVSVVDTTNPRRARVRRTLLVGDEPRDIVFAGEHGARAFITTAHRGQNNPNDPQLTTPGVGRADVWVFDANALGSTPLSIVTLFADTPRALAVSPDGATVYAAAFHSGNQTTALESGYVTDGGPGAPDGFGLPAPTTNYQGIPQPDTGLIVRYDGQHWRDHPSQRIWDHLVKFDLPDLDVFAIDANADPPSQVAGTAGEFAGVGTVLFNMVVNPASGKLYVSNTEALNEVRFEGPGTFGGTTTRGKTHQSRITVIDGGNVQPRHLNKHIDYTTCCSDLPNTENDRSLAQPVDMAVSADGTTLYVAAFGSGKVGVFSTAALENDSFVPDAADHIELTGGGPSGLVLDEARGRLYVLTRFDNTVSVIDTATRTEIARRQLFSPEPAHVIAGRPFLYDARLTSSNGESSCASCHVFGDLDSLGWDLGDPDAEPTPNPGPLIDPVTPFPGAEDFQPLKGPMTTQSLRGMANHGPMHWRGDRNGNNETGGVSAQPDTGLYDERQAFSEFNPAFEGLVGGPRQLTPEEMTAFTDFILELTYPPNPIRALDNSLTESQARGRDHFFIDDSTPRNPFIPGETVSCQFCHVLNPLGNAEYGIDKPGFFGTDGLGLVESGGLQHLKVPHFRNLYQKVDMFGIGFLPFMTPHQDFSHQGDQIRGFGFIHNGGVDTIFRFISIVPFSDLITPAGFPFGPEGDSLRRDVEAFLLAFDSNLAPIVGQQVTLNQHNAAEAGPRIDLMISRASTEVGPDAHAPECELVVTTRRGKREKGYLYVESSGVFVQSDHDKPDLTDAQLRNRAQHSELTYTCVPLGSGVRIGLDADLDGCYNRTEVKLGTDPRDPSSAPVVCETDEDDD